MTWTDPTIRLGAFGCPRAMYEDAEILISHAGDLSALIRLSNYSIQW
jgi:hypothetical protein